MNVTFTGQQIKLVNRYECYLYRTEIKVVNRFECYLYRTANKAS